MSQNTSHNTLQTQRATTSEATWGQAYRAFLLSRHESLLLKIAPFAIMLGMPEVVGANLLPIIGELGDLGTLALSAFVILKTILAVSKYRYINSA